MMDAIVRQGQGRLTGQSLLVHAVLQKQEHLLHVVGAAALQVACNRIPHGRAEIRGKFPRRLNGILVTAGGLDMDKGQVLGPFVEHGLAELIKGRERGAAAVERNDEDIGPQCFVDKGLLLFAVKELSLGPRLGDNRSPFLLIEPDAFGERGDFSGCG